MANTNKKLLVQSAIVLAMAVSPMAADAADVAISTAVTTQQTTGANDDDLDIDSGGSLVVTGDEAYVAGAHTGLGINVDAESASTNAIKSTGDFSTLDFSNNTATISSINITTGIVTGASTTAGKGTIQIDGAADAYTITIGANGTVSNTDAATGGEAIVISGAAGNQTATIANSGTISTAHASSIAVNFLDANGGSALSLSNASGATIGGTGTTAINIGTSGGGGTGNDLTITSNAGTITGAITGGVDALDGMTITSSGTITGAITATAGDLSITNTGDITGNIDLGTGTGSLLNVNGDSGAVITGTVTLGDNGQVVTFNGGTLTGGIDGAAGANGTVKISADTTSGGTIGSTNGIASLVIDAGDTLTLGHNVKATASTISGTLDLGNSARTLTTAATVGAAGIVDLGTASHSTTGIFTTASTSVIKTDITTRTSSGKLTQSAGSVALDADTDISITVAATDYIETGDEWTIISGTTAHSDLTSADITDTSVILSFAADVGTAGAFKVDATRVAYNTIATLENSDNIAAALNTIGDAATDSGTLSTFLGAADSATSAANLDSILEQATPQADNGLSQGIVDITSQSLDVVSNRLNGLRSGVQVSSLTGMAAGDGQSGRGAWGEIFGATTKQDLRDGVQGYNADTVGISIGADRAVGENSRVGLALSYALSAVDSKDSRKSTDVNTYQANLYGSRDYGRYYVDGLLGFAWNSYDSERRIPAASEVANGNFDGQTYLAKVGGGYKVTNSRGLEIVPNAGLTYAYNHVESYNEKDAGALNLHVKNDDTSSLVGKAGLNVGKTFSTETKKIRPEVRVAAMYDLIGDEQATTSNFTGVGTSFSTKGSDVQRFSYTAGAGVDIVTQKGVTLSADYDYEGKSDYASHSGMLKVRYDF